MAIEQKKEELKLAPLIIQYTNILHKHGIGSYQATSFRDQYIKDKSFQRRANVLETLINNKSLFK